MVQSFKEWTSILSFVPLVLCAPSTRTHARVYIITAKQMCMSCPVTSGSWDCLLLLSVFDCWSGFNRFYDCFPSCYCYRLLLQCSSSSLSERAFQYNFYFSKCMLLWKESYILLVNIERMALLSCSLRLQVSDWVWYFSWWSLPPISFIPHNKYKYMCKLLCVVLFPQTRLVSIRVWHHFWECTFHPCVPFLHPNYKNENKHCGSFEHGCLRAYKFLTEWK